MNRITIATYFLASSVTMLQAIAAEVPDFSRQIQPILTKYCAGCHNDDDHEGKLSLVNYDALLKGGMKGAVVNPNHAELSRLLLVISGKAEPVMPPKGNERPQPDEVALLAAWIDAGAKGPRGKGPDPTQLVTPRIPLRAPARPSVNAIAVSPLGNVVAIARDGEVELQSFPNRTTLYKFDGIRGRVNAVSFSRDGQYVVAAAGEPGLFGEVRLWSVSEGQLKKLFQGHKDSLYCVRLSPDGQILATGGYDNQIKLWNVETGQELRTLEGHNGAVFDCSFRSDGKILASASGDRTVKLWDVATGARLDTLKESTKELYTLTFSPDGKRVAAAGIDNRIRVWEVSADAKEGTNPLLFSQFAHESPVLRVAWSADGKTVVSTGEDRLIKIFDAPSMNLRGQLEKQSDWPTGLAILPAGNEIVVGRIDGSVGSYPLEVTVVDEHRLMPLAEVPPEVDYGPQPKLEELPKTAEIEPNDIPGQATPLILPGIAIGRIFGSDRGQVTDADVFRIEVKSGEQWIIETNAARSGAPLDSKIEVLDKDGQPVPRMLLRAVRDSELEFRGVSGDARGGRLKNWDEMLVNDLVYIEGEVVKQYRQRRGPDAENDFYPDTGSRFCYFDTTPRAHAVGTPAYVVVPYAVGTKLPNNGLPIIPIYYENDDDSQRKIGKDSRLTFVAPMDGEYFIRVSDVRNFAGENFGYQLIVRRPQPDFKVALTGNNPTVNLGSGKQFSVKAERIDNFNGPIRIDITGLPPGYQATTPLIIQAGLLEASGSINCLLDAPAPNDILASASKISASAMISGKNIVHEVNSLGVIKQGEKPKVIVHLELMQQPVTTGNVKDGFPKPQELVMTPGAMITCKLRVERNGFDDRISIDIPNLPHGVIIDDIGLNGILIVEGQTERTVYLRSEAWVPDQSRPFFAVAQVEGNQVSCPMILAVRRGEMAVGKTD